MSTNQIDLVIHPQAAEASSASTQILLKLLDWPFLIFLLVVILAIVFRKQLIALFNKDKILIKWGDKSILLSDLGKKIEQDIDTKFDSLGEEHELTQKRVFQDLVEKHPQKFNEFVADFSKFKGTPAEPLERMKEALMSPDFRWRTLTRLAAIAGLSEQKARALLPQLGVDFDVSKTGQTIVKLKAR